EVLSIVLVIVISETDGALASLSLDPPVGLLIPRPTPHWKLLSWMSPAYPLSVTSPLIVPNFMKIGSPLIVAAPWAAVALTTGFLAAAAWMAGLRPAWTGCALDAAW